METVAKKLLFKYIIPLLVFISKTLFGNRSGNTGHIENMPHPFFIMGSGRNGSTLTAQLLNRHPEIFLPPEQTVLPFSIMKWHLKRWTNWNDIVAENAKDYSIYNQNWHLKEKDYGQISCDLSNFDKRHRNPSNIFTLVFRHYGLKSKQSLKFIGDHSPMCTVHHKMIVPEFRSAKFICLIRHPFDVILSYSKFKENPASETEYACWKWNNSIEAYEYLKKEVPQNVMLVKYEDLTETTKDTLSSIFKFLGAKDVDISELNEEEVSNDALGTSGYEHHKNLSKPVGNFSVNKWKKELSESTYKQALALVKKNASKFDYDLTR
jgi:hypothetical protein